MKSPTLVGMLVIGGLVAGAQGVSAQAVCSAPHSSPTLAGSGAGGALPPGAAWLQLSVYAQDATETFDPRGERKAFVTGAEFRTRSVFLTGALGLVRGLEVWAQVPVHRLSVDGRGGRSDGDGVGDVRLATRFGAELVGLDLPVALRVGVKVPGSEFPVDARLLPLSEGQTDVEASLEAGHLFSGRSLYVVGWIGVRWRGENTTADRTPGDELFLHGALGGAAGEWTMELAVAGLRGRAPEALGFRLANEGRRLVQLVPTVGRTVGPGHLEFTVQAPLAGRNLPAAPGFSLGYRLTRGS